MSVSKPSWKLRRRAVFGALLFGMAVVSYVAIRWEDTQLAQTLVLSSFALIGSVIAAYTGFAVLDDKNVMQAEIQSQNTTTEEDGELV